MIEKLKEYFEKSAETDNPFVASEYLLKIKELEECFDRLKLKLFDKLKIEEVGGKFEDENIIVQKLEKQTYDYSAIFEYRQAEKALNDVKKGFQDKATKKTTIYHKINKKKG